MKALSARRLIRLLSASALVATLAVASLPGRRPRGHSHLLLQRLRDETTGWNPNGVTVTRVASGDTSTTYATGVPAATGGSYARLSKATSNTTCLNGGGTRLYEGSSPGGPAPGTS